MTLMKWLVVASVALTIAASPTGAQLRGHGGPVRTLAVAPDGQTALSGSFDGSAIRWSLTRNSAEQVLRFHDGAVNAVATLPDGRLATAGEDGRIALWVAGEPRPARVFTGHSAPVVSLSVAPDGKTLASASWDQTVRLWPLNDEAGSKGDEPRVLSGHTQNVNGVTFTADGTAVVSVGYDAALRIWRLAEPDSPVVTTLPTPLNAVTVAGDEIVTTGADGQAYFLSLSGEVRSAVKAQSTPGIAVGASSDGKFVAVAGIRGSVAIIDRATRQVLRSLVGPGLPVWSLVFLPDNRTLLTGGNDRMVRRWNVTTGEHIGAVVMGPEDPLVAYAGDHGADVFRACVACHTLKPDEGNRAGPTLAGIFGRKIATLPGYAFSEALKKLDIVWTPETVAKLFEIGPATYTPGTKMPEQTIGSAEDRAALVRFLEKATQ